MNNSNNSGGNRRHKNSINHKSRRKNSIDHGHNHNTRQKNSIDNGSNQYHNPKIENTALTIQKKSIQLTFPIQKILDTIATNSEV